MLLTFDALVGRVPLGAGVVLALAVCWPAVMFAVERANMDIVLFSLMALSLLPWRGFRSSAAAVLSPVLVLLCATAKLYPVFAFPAFLVARSRIAAQVTVLCIAAFAAYVVSSLRDIVHVAEIAAQGQLFSYGARILPAHLYHQIGADRWAGPPVLKQLIAAAPVTIIAVATELSFQRRFTPQHDGTTVAGASLLAPHIGALIYLGTFVTANNFDYRLVFLLLTLPQLVEWASVRGHRLSLLASTPLGAAILLLWVGTLSEALNLWDELVSWAVAGLLTAVIAATVSLWHSVRKSTLGRLAIAGRRDP